MDDLRRFVPILVLVCVFSISFCQNADIRILSFMHRDSTRVKDVVFKGLTNSGNVLPFATPIAMIGTGELLKMDDLKRNGMKTGASVLLTGMLTTCVKFGVNRPRPFRKHPELFRKRTHAGPFSFPSGHTSMAFATATALTLSNPKWQVAVPSYLWAGGVAASRMYFGVHYPSDVLGGIVIGVGSSLLIWQIDKWVTNVRY